MDFTQLAANRYSQRGMLPTPVEEEKLLRILETGRIAPTAKNNQPQRIYACVSAESLEKIRRATPCHFQAPLVFLVCYDQNEAAQVPGNDLNFGLMDACIVTCHMMLQAQELGLSSTWVGRFDPKIISTEFSLPENIIPAALLPVGYADPQIGPSERHASRLPLEQTCRII